MNDLIFSAHIVLPLFFLIIVGATTQKIGIIDSNFIAKGNALSFKVLLPTLLFLNIYNSKDSGYFEIHFACFLLVSVLVIFFASWGILRLFYKDNKKLSVLIQCSFRSNTVLLGIYIMANLYGEIGNQKIAPYLGVVVVLFNILATFILEFYSGKKSSKKAMLFVIAKNPLIIASLIGFVVNLTGIRFGYIIEKTLSNIASISTIFAMICLGGNLKIETLKHDKWNLLVGSVIRLIIVPAIVCFVAYVFGFREERMAIVLIIFATPVAVSSYIMAQQQGADADLAGGLVASTTLLSILSLFLFIYIFKTLGIF